MKTRLFRTVVAFLFAGLALTQVGCYDQQIEDLNNRIDELTTGKIASIESQYSSLQTTLASLKSASDAMASKNAALEATIKSIEGTLDGFLTKSQLDATLASYATVAQLGELTAALDGVEDAAVKAAVEAAVKAAGDALEESFQTKFDAAFAKATEGLTADIEAKLDAAVADLDKKIADAVAEAMKNNGEVSTEDLCEANKVVKQFLSGRLTSLLLVPELYVDGIETVEVEVLEYYEWTKDAKAEAYEQDDLAPWTTSYMWEEIQYTVGPKVVATEDIETPSFVFNVAETRTTGDAPEFTVIPAEYEQLFGVKPYEIKGGVLTVRGVKRAASVDVEHAAGAEKAWIGALEAPIAAKHLMENEAGAVVRSDWAKFIQVNHVPYIAAAIDLNEGLDPNAKPSTAGWSCTLQDHNHFSATYAAAQRTAPSQVAVYTDELNLTEMVTGCLVKEDGSIQEFTQDEMAKSGLKLEFYAPTETYAEGSNKVDQQQFIKVYEKDGVYYAKSKLPRGDENNEAAAGKTPVVCVKMIDTNNNNAIVDVRYFKVKWILPDNGAINLNIIKTFNYTLCNCDFFGEFTWDDMVETILKSEKWPDGVGISYEEFFQYYDLVNVDGAATTTDTNPKRNVGMYGQPANNSGDVKNLTAMMALPMNAAFEVGHNFDTDPESATVMVWHLTIDQIDAVIDDLLAGKEVTRNVTITLKPKFDNYAMYGDLIFSFQVNINLPQLAVMNDKYMGSFWKEIGKVARVYPVQFGTKYNGIEGYGNNGKSSELVTYDYPLYKLFDAYGVFVKNLLPCSYWNMHFGSSKTNEIVDAKKNVLAEMTLAEDDPLVEEPYHSDNCFWFWQAPLKPDFLVSCDGICDAKVCVASKNGMAMAEIVLKDGEYNRENGIVTGQAMLGEQLLIYKDGQPQTETIEFTGYLNYLNSYKIGDFTVEFIKPLDIKAAGVLEFTDQMTLGDKKNYHNLVSIVDCYKEVVDAMPNVEVLGAEKAAMAEKLAKYYDVKNYRFGWDEAKIVSGPDAGKYVEDVFAPAADRTWYQEDAQLDNVTFYNWTGVKLETDCEIEVPATVHHKWGSENFIIKGIIKSNANVQQ